MTKRPDEIGPTITEPDTAAEAATDTPPEETPPAAEESEPEPETPHSREARYRQQLRTVEAERDQLRDRLERHDRAEVERLAEGKLADPADVWRGGVELADLLDDSGELDPDLIGAAISKVIAEHPHWQRGKISPAAPASAVTSDGNPHDDPRSAPASWQKVFQKARGVGED
jgi:hypothetical protein